MSNVGSPPALPDAYEIISGPFPLLKNYNIWWVSLVKTPASEGKTASGGEATEAGLYIYSSLDAARTFWYPEEALTALTILREMEPQLLYLLEQQGMYTQQGRNEDDEPIPN